MQLNMWNVVAGHYNCNTQRTIGCLGHNDYIILVDETCCFVSSRQLQRDNTHTPTGNCCSSLYTLVVQQMQRA